MSIENAEAGQPICRGHTTHAITDTNAKPIRPPQWVLDLLNGNPAAPQ